ncbi:MAG: hypothetical protein RMJ86_00820 [Anaerolineae bacterium]|nr:hypothetical protein [Thermoflexales bacterium]MDW8053077.1 hypothetical protein [Anaerolineae bacterium]
MAQQPPSLIKCSAYTQNVQRYSPLRPWYWVLFFACLALVVGLNLPFPQRPPQNPSALLQDSWFIWGFSYFGLLIMPVAALMIEDARQRGLRWAPYVILYFFVGILPLSVYMARRPAHDQQRLPTPAWLSQRWFWALLALAVPVISVALLPRGSLEQLVETMRQNLGLTFMWLDIALNHVVALPLAQADMQRRHVQGQGAWLLAILLTGALGLCLYMATRPAHSSSLFGKRYEEAAA